MLVTFLQENQDIFAWKPSDMPGVPREVIEHCLNVKEGVKPVKQRLRQFAQDRKEAIRDELTKLTAVNFIREVYHPDWLANPVLVKRRTGSGACALITRTSTKRAPKIRLGYPASIRL